MIWKDLTTEDWKDLWLMSALLTWAIFLGNVLELIATYYRWGA